MLDFITLRTHISDPWRGFMQGPWQNGVDIRNFLQLNCETYTGAGDFLAAPAMAANDDLPVEDALKAAFQAAGGLGACPISFKKNKAEQRDLQAVEAGTPKMSAARASGLFLPDGSMLRCTAFDARCVALYGIAGLKRERLAHLKWLDRLDFTEPVLRERVGIARQLQSLDELRELALSLGLDLDRPAADAHEAVQWMCTALMAAVDDPDEPALAMGRASNFLDAYLQRDLYEGTITELTAQRLVDEWVQRLAHMQRLCRSVQQVENLDPRTPAVECLAGMADHGRALVTRTSWRLLNTLMRQSPHEGMAVGAVVLWSPDLPRAFRDYCWAVQRKSEVLHFEKDEPLRRRLGDDGVLVMDGVAARFGQQVLCARDVVNLPKALLYAINGGVDEESGALVIEGLEPFWGDVLDYETVLERLDKVLDWLAATWVNGFNALQYVHDLQTHGAASFSSESSALMLCRVCGLATLANSLSAMRYADVQVLRNDDGLAVDFKAQETFPTCASADELVGAMACVLRDAFARKLREHVFIYRNAQPVVLCSDEATSERARHLTGNTPCGRGRGEPLADDRFLAHWSAGMDAASDSAATFHSSKPTWAQQAGRSRSPASPKAA